MESSAFKNRLPSALLALLIQAGLIGLLIFSFKAVRPPQHEQETILFLSRLPTRKVEPGIATIDARGAPPASNRSAKAPALPPLVQPDSNSTPIAPNANAPSSPGALHSLGQALFDCAPERLANLPPDARANCLPSKQGLARKDGTDAISPPYQANDEAHWNEEMARKNAPVGLPGAAGGPLGIIITALTNPGAYADKKSYTYPSPPAPLPMTGADALYHAAHSAQACPTVMPDFVKTVCENDVAALGGGEQYVATAAASPSKIHASEAQFQAALKAYQQRRGAVPVIEADQKLQ